MQERTEGPGMTTTERMVRLTVRYYAAARDLAGTSEEQVDLGGDAHDTASVREALAERHPRLAGYLARMRLAVNGDFVEEGARVSDGDEVVVLPPVAGGNRDPLVSIREEPLSVDECMRAVAHASAGGICVFVGVVRDTAEGKSVARLDYEAYTELALEEMRRILGRIEAANAGVRLAATHRVGELAVGDLAVVVAASAPHRAEAFAACREAIDAIKDTVPIWKKEWDAQGSAVWVNLDEPE